MEEFISKSKLLNVLVIYYERLMETLDEIDSEIYPNLWAEKFGRVDEIINVVSDINRMPVKIIKEENENAN